MDSLLNQNERGLVLSLISLLIRTVALIFLLHATVFIIFDVLPDAALTRLGIAALNKDLLEDTRLNLGLNESVGIRYAKSMTHFARFEFGKSLQSGYPVSLLLWKSASNSLPYILCASLIVFMAMRFAAWWYCQERMSVVQRLILRVSHLSMIPQFSSGSSIAIGAVFATTSGVIASSDLLVQSKNIGDILMIISIALMPAGLLFIAAAQTAQDIVKKPFVLTHRCMGLPWSRIRILLQVNINHDIFHLANRVSVALILGTVFSEVSFDRPGIGAVLAEAIRSGDQPVAAGWMLAVGAPTIFLSQIATAWHQRKFTS
jgi:ABC-type dipeptide/oligopeptide/nickel transport system permease component